MAKFYGTLQGNRQEATKTGSRFIKSSVRSYDGSIATKLYYNDNQELCITIEHNSGSSSFGDVVYDGKVAEFLEMLSKSNHGRV